MNEFHFWTAGVPVEHDDLQQLRNFASLAILSETTLPNCWGLQH